MYTRDKKDWSKHLDFLLLDELCLLIALSLGTFFRHGTIDLNSQNLTLVLLALLTNFFVLVSNRTFSSVLKRGYYKELIATLKSSIFSLLILLAFLFITKSGAIFSRIAISISYLIYFVLTYLTRILFKKFVRHNNNNNAGKPAALIVGSKKSVSALLKEVESDVFIDRDIRGIILNTGSDIKTIDNVKVVGNYKNVVKYVTHHWVDEIIVPSDPKLQLDASTLRELVLMGVTIHMALPNSLKDAGAKEVVSSIGTMPVLSATLNYVTPTDAFYKRLMDIVGGIVGSLFTLIIFIFVAPIIYIKSPGPIFFTQTRIGKNGKKFKMYKFRSMYPDAEDRLKDVMKQNRVKDGYMFKMKYDPRIIGNYIDDKGKQHTGIGEFIRKTSLDEFPQFFNVLKGDMSLVGTRPPLENEYAKYSAHHKARLAMKPGITGLWQVSGRSNITDFDEVVRLDTTYINEWSIGLDIKILFKTIAVVFKKEGSM